MKDTTIPIATGDFRHNFSRWKRHQDWLFLGRVRFDDETRQAHSPSLGLCRSQARRLSGGTWMLENASFARRTKEQPSEADAKFGRERSFGWRRRACPALCVCESQRQPCPHLGIVFHERESRIGCAPAQTIATGGLRQLLQVGRDVKGFLRAPVHAANTSGHKDSVSASKAGRSGRLTFCTWSEGPGSSSSSSETPMWIRPPISAIVAGSAPTSRIKAFTSRAVRISAGAGIPQAMMGRLQPHERTAGDLCSSYRRAAGQPGVCQVGNHVDAFGGVIH